MGTANTKGVTFCSDINYGGKCVTVDAGNYDMDAISSAIGNDAVSSIKIATPGYSAKTYADMSYGGAEMDFSTDNADLRNVNWNDTISSVKIIAPATATPAPVVVTPAPVVVTPAATTPAATTTVLVPSTTADAASTTPSLTSSSTPALSVSTAPTVTSATPAGTADEMSNSTWIIIAVCVLFFILITVGGLMYYTSSKAKTGPKPAAAVTTGTPFAPAPPK